jgi:hypothetical protein
MFGLASAVSRANKWSSTPSGTQIVGLILTAVYINTAVFCIYIMKCKIDVRDRGRVWLERGRLARAGIWLELARSLRLATGGASCVVFHKGLTAKPDNPHCGQDGS